MTTSDPLLPIVVGIDDSPPSDLALDWAAIQAAAEGRHLVLLTAVSVPGPESGAWLAAHGIDDVQVRVQTRERARSIARRCSARVHERHPGLEVRHELAFADPRDALLEVEAHLVVLGTRGRGSVRRLLLGSVADTVVKHAARPTVVVRTDRDDAVTREGVVVGVAGDAGDAGAVDLAFELATARGLPVTAYHCVLDVDLPDDSDEVRDLAPDESGAATARQLLSAAVESASRRHPAVEVRQRVTDGFADQRLIQASITADIVVVGHRRKHFLTELVYGSAAPRVVEHARCTVAVVPYRAEDEAPATER